MEDTMTSARDAAIRPSTMATQFNSTPMSCQIEDAFALYGKWLGVAIADCEAWFTVNPAFQRCRPSPLALDETMY